MRVSDLLKMSLSSLFKRKVRSILTILGVVVGTASIIVMISIGLGLQKTTEDTMADSFSLTSVNVSDYNKETSGGFHLTDSTVAELSQIEHVIDVIPVLFFSSKIITGQYIDDLYMSAVPAEKIPEMAKNAGSSGVSRGEYPTAGSGVRIVVPEDEKKVFRNKANKNFYDTGVLPEFDFLTGSFQIVYDTANYKSSGNATSIVESQSAEQASGDGNSDSGSMGNQTSSGNDKAIVAKKYPVEFCGVTDDGFYSYVSMEDFLVEVKKVFRNRVIPGQPAQKNGKPYSEIYYDECYVMVDDIDNVQGVLDTLKNDYSAQAYANAEYLNSMQEQNKSIQNMLGAVGIVSLFVAALGIANTMMMSIYERTKEIGVMKVLGCTLSDIRALFLLEAAYIGFIGGVIGVGLSYGISYMLNNFAGDLGLGSSELGYFAAEGIHKTTSYIPPYLALLGLVFSVVVGILSGLLPAIRAMRLSPLAAIRNE